MDDPGSDVTNRARVGSHTASDVRRIASLMHFIHAWRTCSPRSYSYTECLALRDARGADDER